MEADLPRGFSTVADAIALIGQHTQKEPTVDMLFLVDNSFRIREKKNFRIARVKRNEKGKIERLDSMNVEVKTKLQQEELKEAIRQKFAEITGRSLNINEVGLKRLTTAVTDEGNSLGHLQPNATSNIKLGDPIQSGVYINTNGQN